MGGRRVKKIKSEATEKPKPKAKAALPGKKKAVKPPQKLAEKPVTTETRRRKEARKAGKQKVRGRPRKASRKTSSRDRSPRGKRYRAAIRQLADRKGKPQSLSEAIKFVKESLHANFDASVEVHINLGLEADKAEHRVRTAVVLPHGTGKKVKVLVFAKDEAAKAATKAGADRIGDEETVEEIAEAGKAEFDCVVATPEFMPKLAKIGRILGPQGLMPSPKSGTASDNPAEVVSELKKGRIELRTEKQPIIHTVIGKVSFSEKALVENLRAIVEELLRVKPSKVRGEYIRSIFLKSTMGPSVKVDVGSLKE